MGRLQDKVVIILGASNAASMGAATARRFAREGARLVLAARGTPRLDAIAMEVGGLAMPRDIGCEDDVARLAEAAVARYGRLGTVEDVANAALWLASDESASTTGQVIDVTSGQSLRRTPTDEEVMQ